MREAAFVKRNTHRWEEFARTLNNPQRVNPDVLADIFIKLTDDLAYARTYYPDSRTTAYLNAMAMKVHQAIYRNKKESAGRLVSFWKTELPLLFKSVHRELLLSFLVFVLAMLIGALSAAYDENFVRLIMGDDYVNMTLENIGKGDPMGIYKSDDQLNMFFSITRNNILVAFKTFASAVLTSIFTLVILFQNGIMLGAFQFFFYQKGLFLTSFLTIWIHGTLEISAIVIAGAAGFTMGNSLLFPGTYPRLDAFRIGAKKGLKITMGLVPIFIMAGFLESFVTRLTDMPVFLKVMILVLSAAFIIYYFIIYPIQLNKKLAYNQEDETHSNYVDYTEN